MRNDFKNIDYLKSGNPKQQQAFQVLTKLNIFELLGGFNPILVGTIPIKIDISTSDLDVICRCSDHHQFSKVLLQCFKEKDQFSINTSNYQSILTTICSFNYNGFDIEIFAQDIPVEEQNAYKHMVIEARILAEQGEEFRRAVIALKTEGMKTEPAFAKLLGLTGDPYEALLEYE